MGGGANDEYISRPSACARPPKLIGLVLQISVASVSGGDGYGRPKGGGIAMSHGCDEGRRGWDLRSGLTVEESSACGVRHRAS